MVIRKNIDLQKELTPEQIAMLDALDSSPSVPDDDCPELSAEQLAQIKQISAQKRLERNKQTVTIRLSPQALKKAKSLGKGYTSVLSRILEKALSDNEMIKEYL